MIFHLYNNFNQTVSKLMVNRYEFYDNILQFKDGFDEPLEPYYNIMVQASRVIFPSYFNHPIVLFPNTIHLETRRGYDLPIVLTHNILTLIIDAYYKYFLKLSSKIETLIMLKYSSLLELNKNMKYLQANESFDHNRIICLNKIMYHTMFECANNQVVLNKKLKKFCMWGLFNQPLELPKHLLELTFGYKYDKKILLPSSINYLSVCYCCKGCVMLDCATANSINILIDSRDYYLIDNLPNSKGKIVLKYRLNSSANNLPTNLIVGGRF